MNMQTISKILAQLLKKAQSNLHRYFVKKINRKNTVKKIARIRKNYKKIPKGMLLNKFLLSEKIPPKTLPIFYILLLQIVFVQALCKVLLLQTVQIQLPHRILRNLQVFQP